ncbi:unnamed protein product, partial [Prorocentrum cordatum]
ATVDEGWNELAALGDDARRKHVHWVHVRIGDPDHWQPSALSRGELWEHMRRCHGEQYPADANPTKYILTLGIATRERHHYSRREQGRELHAHFIAHCPTRHHWRGDLPQRRLQAGAHAGRANRGQSKPDAPGGGQHAESCFRTSDLQRTAQRTEIRTAPASRAHAQDLAGNGDSSLSEFCTVEGAGLQGKLNAA